MVKILTLPGVFRPRSDSWMLARSVAAEPAVRAGGRVLDVCTGSGVVAVAAARAGAEVTAVDVSRRAVATVALNARRNGVRVRARRGDLLRAAAGERYDIVCSNPPYVPCADDALPARGARRAWDAGRDGRALLDRLLDGVADVLRPGGVVLVVHSDLIGTERTLAALERAGLRAAVVAREPGPLGPLMRERRDQGLLPAGVDHEDVVIVRGTLSGSTSSASTSAKNAYA